MRQNGITNRGTREIDLLPEILSLTVQHLATCRLTSAAVFDFTSSQSGDENKKSYWPQNSLRTGSGKCTLGMSYFSSSSISHRDDLSLEPALMSVRTWQPDRFHGEQNKTSKKHREEPCQLQNCLEHNQSTHKCSPWHSHTGRTNGKEVNTISIDMPLLMHRFHHEIAECVAKMNSFCLLGKENDFGF